MPDKAIHPIPKQGKFRRALTAVGAWLQALDYTGYGQAACVGHGDEVAEMPEFHHILPCLVSMGPAYKVFLEPTSGL